MIRYIYAQMWLCTMDPKPCRVLPVIFLFLPILPRRRLQDVIHASRHRRLALIIRALIERMQRASSARHVVPVPSRCYPTLAPLSPSTKPQCGEDLPTMKGALGCQLASRTQVDHCPISSNRKKRLSCPSMGLVPLVASRTSITLAIVASML